MSHLRHFYFWPMTLLVLALSLPSWAQSNFLYRLGEVKTMASEVSRLAQAIESETRYSYRSGLGLEASELARSADYFRSSLDAYRPDEYQVRQDFESLKRNYRQTIAYEGSIWGNYSLARLLSDLRLTMERLTVIFRHEQQGSVFAHLEVRRLANRIDQNATALFRSVEADLSRYGAVGYAEREAIKSLLDLAVAARHLEHQVHSYFQDRTHTRRDAEEVSRRFKHAEAQLAFLPLGSTARQALNGLSMDVYELQRLYGLSNHNPYDVNDPFGRGGNDPYGRGGSYDPGGYPTDPSYPSYPSHPGSYTPSPVDTVRPCLDPYLCGPIRGTAPSVRIF